MGPQLDIVGVIAEEVGTPRNDGTAGSGLYAVPIRLTRAATMVESQLLVEVWDRPPSFTTMHRPGILRVSGSKVVLDGTTIDEVARYHATTLRIVIDRVNELAAEHQQRDAAEKKRLAEERRAHGEHVTDVSQAIDFN